MSEPKKKSGVAFWATVVAVVLLPIVYVASYGPWLATGIRGRLSQRNLSRIESTLWYPMGYLVLDSPEWIANPYLAYLEWWSDDPVLGHAREYRRSHRSPEASR